MHNIVRLLKFLRVLGADKGCQVGVFFSMYMICSLDMKLMS